MISQKIMDWMDASMINKECMNCGSTQFHQVENGWQCDYCGTLYIEQKKKQPPEPIHHQSTFLKQKSRLAIGVILALGFISLGPLNYFISKADNNEPAVSYEPIEIDSPDSTTATKLPGKWTQDIYDSVKVATEVYDADNEKYSFTGGSNYKELEKLVGKPDTLISWEKEEHGMPPRVLATWENTEDGEYVDHSISVTYEKKTQRITDKDYQ